MLSGTFTPTLIPPPQGGGDKKRGNPCLKEEDSKYEIIHPSKKRGE